MNIVEACRDPNLFARWFKDPATWAAWLAFLAALFALPMDNKARDIYWRCTGQSAPPGVPFSEAWIVAGRRGGKSFILALVAVFLACFKDWRPYLAPGERGTVMVIATDRRQARVIFRYIEALVDGVPMLGKLVTERVKESIDLANRVTIEVHTCSFRTVRGYTVVAALCDEIAFWRSDESLNPDHEILNALRPAMATVPGAMLLCASSPYARRGALYQAWQEHFGKDSPTLVWQADTRTMNPTVPQRVIRGAYERDSTSAAAEYGAQFRSDVESFVLREAVDACVVLDRRELPPVEGVAYLAFTDPSGGSADSMTLAIAHREKEVVVLDVLRERKPPFSPEAVVDEFAALLKSYRVGTVQGDKYAGEWPRERFRKAGIGYRPTNKSKSDLYRDMLPALNSSRVELLDHPKLVNQVCSLERRTARGGRDSIGPVPGAHDDLANVLAGVAALRAQPSFTGPLIWSFDDAPRGLVSPGASVFRGGNFEDWIRNG
jgi:hypothetical protein